MKAAHTAGPWGIAEWTARDSDGSVENGGLQVVDAEGYAISAATIEGDTEQEEANVRLIAAAPELLAALRIADQFCGSLTSDECPDSVHIPIRAAIAKATGAN